MWPLWAAAIESMAIPRASLAAVARDDFTSVATADIESDEARRAVAWGLTWGGEGSLYFWDFSDGFSRVSKFLKREGTLGQVQCA